MEECFGLFGQSGDQVQTDIITYTAAIRACEGDQWQQAVGVFCLLLQSALEADEMSYSALLSGTPAPRWQHAVSLAAKVPTPWSP